MYEAPWSICVIFNEDDSFFGVVDDPIEAQSKVEWLTNKYNKLFYFEKYELMEA
jgi:hypothetical protein